MRAGRKGQLKFSAGKSRVTRGHRWQRKGGGESRNRTKFAMMEKAQGRAAPGKGKKLQVGSQKKKLSGRNLA